MTTTLLPEFNELLELRHQAHALQFATHRRVNTRLSGLYASVFRGQGLEYDETREYCPGDEIRNMDWRVTARKGKPHLKVFKEERERVVMLCVDQGAAMHFGTQGTFKGVQAARAAALLGWAASEQHDRVGGLVFGRAEQPLLLLRASRTRRSLWQLLKTLTTPAPYAPSNEDWLALALARLAMTLQHNALIFIIGDFNRASERLERQLVHLRQRHNLVLFPIDDPVDSELPAMGTALFQDADGQQVWLDTDDAAGRLRYHAAWLARREALGHLASRLNIGLAPLSTAGDVHGVLFQGLQQLARGRQR